MLIHAYRLVYPDSPHAPEDNRNGAIRNYGARGREYSGYYHTWTFRLHSRRFWGSWHRELFPWVGRL